MIGILVALSGISLDLSSSPFYWVMCRVLIRISAVMRVSGIVKCKNAAG